MALSWNEIKNRALKFSQEWKDTKREQAESQSFWNEFFNVFGINRRRVASFEEPVKKLGDKRGRIDLFWKGILLVEHKSRGEDLEKAYTQALDYFPGIKEEELPKYILVSDFEKFKLYNLEEDESYQFLLSELLENVYLFGFMIGYTKQKNTPEDPVNIKAAELMGKLHDILKETGYTGRKLEVYLVRLLFLLFAEDTSIFEKNQFQEYIEQRTQEDGSDLGSKLTELFQVLNTPLKQRWTNLDEDLISFPYVNGKLFEETLPIPSFNKKMREMLLNCCYLDWSKISPAIFGSMFQSVMNPQERRNLGAHYTSEANILKLIKPLFLDSLWQEFEEVKNLKQLEDFYNKLASLCFLDPACGCGNFLVITYRELRLLELAILKELHKNEESLSLSIDFITKINLDQFYGIELEEFPAQIAQVAMWLVDHQANMLLSQELGRYFVRLPLDKSATIINKDALEENWEEIISKNKLSYIIGNPPFIGKQFQNEKQKKDMKKIFNKVKGAGVLDYVTAWYLKAAKYIQGTQIKVAFVSTNSIVQGEQVGILWQELFTNYGIKIHFAHQTFNWSNEAKSNATVSVIIIGFANFDIPNKKIFKYENIQGEAHEIKVKNINPYLVEGNDIVIEKRRTPLCNVPDISFGSMPNDGGNLILSEKNFLEIIEKEPILSNFIRQYMGGDEFLKNIKRYCFWLVDLQPNILKTSKILQERISLVKKIRLESNRETTKNLAKYPTIFAEIRQPKKKYILVPLNTSSTREYLPIGINSEKIIASNLVSIIESESKFIFGVLSSLMHMSWMRYTCGRLGNGYRYSNSIVYNNYPWPKNPTERHIKTIKEKAQKVLDVRAQFPDSSLADLYNPLTMPPALVKAHQELDRAVDLAYRPQPFVSEANRMEFLFGLYEEYNANLFEESKKKKGKKR